MKNKPLKVILESNTGRNLKFQNKYNNEILTDKELINRLETGKSNYNKDYFVRKQNGRKTVVSKADYSKDNNLD